MDHLSLFTGIGGLDLAAEMAGFKTVGQVEMDEYCNQVLECHWPGLPRWRDVKDVTRESFKSKTGLDSPTVLSGGFPCQPVSVAGKRKGDADERWLWDEMFRVIREIRPRWVVAENVRGLLSAKSNDDGRHLFGRILRDLAESGYRAGWLCYGAGDVGAPHRRERVFIVAHADTIRHGRKDTKQGSVDSPKRVSGINRQKDSSAGNAFGTDINQGSEIGNGYVADEKLSSAEEMAYSKFSGTGNKDTEACDQRRKTGRAGATGIRQENRQTLPGRARAAGQDGSMADTDDTGSRTPGHDGNPNGSESVEERRDKPFHRFGGQSKDVADTRCQLRQGSEFKRTDGMEDRRQLADQHKRSDKTSGHDMADAKGGQPGKQKAGDGGQSTVGRSQKAAIGEGAVEPRLGDAINGLSPGMAKPEGNLPQRWPTPRASEIDASKTSTGTKGMNRIAPDGREWGINLSTAVKMWPAGWWATPRANKVQWVGPSLMSRNKCNLEEQVAIAEWGWPAGPGKQHDWEPPRITTGTKDRGKKLKALGNAVVPLQAYPIFKAIIEMENSLSANEKTQIKEEPPYGKNND